MFANSPAFAQGLSSVIVVPSVTVAPKKPVCMTTRDPRHDVLFTPMTIGPKTARNRFYQVPHCNGMGHRDIRALAAMRGMKAEGGWAVVCTEEVEVHPSSDVSPAIEGRLWGDEDLPAHAHIVEAIHAHGALAGIELVYNNPRLNLTSRLPAMGASAMPAASDWLEPTQGRAMDKSDIADVRRWHRQAALRAMRAGYDLVYVYAGHSLALAQHFLSRATNNRSDEYGGSLTNRMRFLRELLEDTKEAVGHACAVPCRIAVEESHLQNGLTRGEIEEIIGTLAELPDAWDFCLGSWPVDSRTARFSGEGFQEPFVQGLKALTTKPVIGVGRFTSPDAMVEQIRSKTLDFIGAARPSIADPFLPRKIAEGRAEDIRECIGCNICVTGDNQSVPIRCTQNPSMGEEWRRAWHPERIASRPPKAAKKRVLIVGGGPSGLEAALALGHRGYEVALADARRELGGRVRQEASLPGLRTWMRVADYRLGQIAKLANVTLYPESRMGIDDVLSFGAHHIAIATGARYRRDGVSRHALQGLPVAPDVQVLTPDDIFEGVRPQSPVIILDDDHGTIGAALAEKCARDGLAVTLATPAPLISYWTQLTLEQAAVEHRLVSVGVDIRTRVTPVSIVPGALHCKCGPTAKERVLPFASIILIGMRDPQNELACGLANRQADWAKAGLQSVTCLGDALAPAMIVHAVYSGHRYAQDLDNPPNPDGPTFRRDTWRP